MPEFAMGPGNCCQEGSGFCLYTWCCPCLAFKEAAENIGEESSSILYCCATFPFLCGCCVLTLLGNTVAEKRGIQQGGMCMSAVMAFLNCCTCYSCSVVNGLKKGF